MASDRLILSQAEHFTNPNDKRDTIKVWVKRYESGRTRLVIDSRDEFEVTSVVNGGNSDSLKLELNPR